jgi:DNA-binding NtrC family response regulator
MPSQQNDRISILLVMPPDTPGFAAILACLETQDIDLVVVSDCRGVRRELRIARPSVVITSVTLSDGNWCDVLSQVVHSELGSSVIVYAQEIDERLRSEVLSRGAYGLVARPSSVRLWPCIQEAHQFATRMPSPATASSKTAR